jgi:NAD(P)-dependent dehydrogenase (short-subunit alcohol dehydrogenase family)
MNPNLSKTVVITGASSGIGKSCVSRLVKNGWRIFATVRRSDDGERLVSEVGAGVTPIILDVEERSSISAAAEQVTAELQGRGLDGLVNVAGIGMVRPLEYATAADLQKIFEVNVFGQIAVSQAFLPLLRQSRGRIVNISSVGAHVAIPFGGLLNASKSAFGLLSDTLRLELHPFGIRVCVIEPAAIKTPAVEKTLGNIEGVIATLPPGGAAEYGEMLTKFAARAYAQESTGSPPDVVARAVSHALTARRPRTRYRVGKHAGLLSVLPRILPDKLLDALLLRVLGLPTKADAAVSAGEGRGRLGGNTVRRLR